MSNSETTIPIGDWTIGSLKVYEDEKLTLLKQLMDERKEHLKELRVADQRAIDAALSAAKEAVTKAEFANDKRFDAANEVKATFGAQLSEKLGVSEYHTAHQALIDKIDGLTVRIAATEGRSSGLNAGWGYLVGIVGLAATVIGLILAFSN